MLKTLRRVLEGGASVMALISIKRGSPVVSVLEEGSKRSFQGEWY
jgi:hypothetical protein